MKIGRLDAPRCTGGENPLWDSAREILFYVDNSGRKVHIYDPATDRARTIEMPSVVTTLALRQAGGAVVTMRSGIYLLNVETEELEALHPLADPPPHVYNDGKVDARGRFIIGASTPKFTNPQPDGGLFRLDPNHSLVRLDSGIHFSNGPCWSPDGRTLYFSDSWLNTVYAYDYDPETGNVSNRRPFVNTTNLGGLPDGATVDVDGLYWVAIYRGGKIAAYRPDGRLERIVEMPVKLVSSVAFGGPQLDRLYVTTIEHDATQGRAAATDGEPDPLPGCLFVIEDLGTRGRAEPMFLG